MNGPLLADLSSDVPGMTINRLCGSGLNAVGPAANAIVSGESDLIIAGGVESMSRAPLVIPSPMLHFPEGLKFLIRLLDGAS